MGRFVIRRLLQMIPLLFGITFLTFAIINLVPGSPVTASALNPRMRPEDRERIIENLGLNEPWPQRYVQWVGNVLQGDLGLSLKNSIPVTDTILSVLPNTLLLTGVSLVLAFVISIPLGIYSAIKRNSWFDNTVTVAATAGYSVPTFWLGLLMIILFGVKFQQWGLYSLPFVGHRSLRETGFLDRVEHLILPAIALAVVDLAGWTRYIRGQMLEVVRQDYVRTAHAKGLANRRVLFSHAFRNALLPLITLVGLSLPGLFGGAFVIETIFSWNGIGRLTVNAANESDYTVVMGTTLMFALLILVANLITDIGYALLDPRIRLE